MTFDEWKKTRVIRISFNIWMVTNGFCYQPNSLDGGERTFMTIHLGVWMVIFCYHPTVYCKYLHCIWMVTSFATIIWCWNWCGWQALQDSQYFKCLTFDDAVNKRSFTHVSSFLAPCFNAPRSYTTCISSVVWFLQHILQIKSELAVFSDLKELAYWFKVDFWPKKWIFFQAKWKILFLVRQILPTWSQI